MRSLTKHTITGGPGSRLWLAACCASLFNCTTQGAETSEDVSFTGAEDSFAGSQNGAQDDASDASGELTLKGPSPFTGNVDTLNPAETTTWFVELDGRSVSEGGDEHILRETHATFYQVARAAGLPFRERLEFTGLLNGVTMSTSSDNLKTLSALPGVRAVYQVGLTSMPQLDKVAEPRLASALGMTGTDTVQSELGFDGTGIRIGIIDSGIDLEHPDFAGRVVAGFDFVGDAYDARNPASLPVPEPGEGSRPGGDDCGGHGTHVAGIAAAAGDPAEGGARGVAPGALLGAYRVFGCDGSTDDDVIVQAIERAYLDGMDVINLSLGSNNGWGQDFLSLALSRVMELGVVPVSSAGNNGRAGTWTLGSPAAGEDVITVASFDNIFSRARKLQLSDGSEWGFNVLSGAPDAPTEGVTEPMVYVGQGCDADEYVGDPTGQVALITRGACTFAEKYSRAFAEGAVGVVIHNQNPGGFAGTLGGEFTDGFGIAISLEAGEAIRAALDAGTSVTIEWTDGFLEEENPTGDLISAFSSYGLTPELDLKPEIGAPGGLIRSTWPLDREDGSVPGYAVLSGTSMSSPYVAGGVALLLQARPDIAPSQVRTALQNAAEPKPWFGNRDAGFLDSVHRQGAGMMRIDRAVLATTMVTPGKLALGESQQGDFETVVYVRNGSDQDATYELGTNINVVQTGGDSNNPSFLLATPVVEYRRVAGGGQLSPIETIDVPAGATRALSVLVKAPEDVPDGTIYGGYLSFTPTGEATASAVSVPFAGFKGDYQQMETLSVAPVIVSAGEAGIEVLEEGQAFSMTPDDYPTVAVGFAHAIKQLRAEIIPHGEVAWLGAQPGFSVDLVRRSNPGDVALFGLGDFDASTLPDGPYSLRFHMLKAEGDPSHPDHTATADSPLFRVAR